MTNSPDVVIDYSVTPETKAHMLQLEEEARTASASTSTLTRFSEYDEMAEAWLGDVRQTPLYEAIAGGGELDHAGLVRVHRDIGYAEVFPFPLYLNNMVRVLVSNGEEGSPAHTFAAVNRRVERTHGRLWKLQAAGLGVSEAEMEDEETYPLSAAAIDLRDHLTRLSEGPTVFAVAGVNFAIETGAAYLTRELASYLLPRMPDRTGTWLEKHAEGDVIHSLISREILERAIGDNKELRIEVGKVMLSTFDKSLELYRGVYPGQAAA